MQEACGLMTVPEPIPIFFNDVSKQIALKAAADLLPLCMFILTTATPTPYSHCCAYIRCSNDSCTPIMVQDLMTGIEWQLHMVWS